MSWLPGDHVEAINDGRILVPNVPGLVGEGLRGRASTVCRIGLLAALCARLTGEPRTLLNRLAGLVAVRASTRRCDARSSLTSVAAGHTLDAHPCNEGLGGLAVDEEAEAPSFSARPPFTEAGLSIAGDGDSCGLGALALEAGLLFRWRCNAGVDLECSGREPQFELLHRKCSSDRSCTR
eukprot:3257413-Pleurochrysis_carterae.AAC.2